MLSGYKTYILCGLAAGFMVLGNGLEAVTNPEELIELIKVAAVATLRAGVNKA
jgi:hypothetical protein